MKNVNSLEVTKAVLEDLVWEMTRHELFLNRVLFSSESHNIRQLAKPIQWERLHDQWKMCFNKHKQLSQDIRLIEDRIKSIRTEIIKIKYNL